MSQVSIIVLSLFLRRFVIKIIRFDWVQCVLIHPVFFILFVYDFLRADIKVQIIYRVLLVH